ncbi:winged helix-turn-helix domain-containing protein [Lewinella sp. 4G2]|uniref:winged helix-turn-helix domain-containing protein n=1 Tax=Lewinella sp. 4G2 TaxID=1803372 RepID=UPI0007B495B6|nr:winged helix-turn-helix domain-containing protein [Lewinella sp. 4G2]OAV42742.1 hypothetical protein A3850_016000 [Lewinella sp. 4G2]
MQQWVLRLSRVIGLALLLVTLTGALWPEGENQPVTLDLVVRQLGHDYLLARGDSTSRIPAVVREDGSYLLRLSAEVDYDLLAATAPITFAKAGLNQGYSLTLTDCASGEVFLGSAFPAPGFAGELVSGQPACIGRDQEARCANARVYFSSPQANPSPTGRYLLGGAGALLLIIGLAFRRSRLVEEHPTASAPSPVDGSVVAPPRIAEPEAVSTTPGVIRINDHCSLDPQSLELSTAAGADTITFREAKLLEYLSDNRNEVLPRARIHEAVWGEEGVLTGRSLDVFVSRLRKKIKEVPGVEIQTVHGIGYRFRVEG